MNKKHLVLCFSVILLTSIAALPSSAFFVEWEDLIPYFTKPKKQVVHAINNYGSPASIVDASVYDQGSARFKTLTDVFHTFTAQVKNNTGRRILSYELTWTMKHPFEDYVYHTIHTNSIDPLDANASQTIKFQRDKHFREDAYYFVEVTKVQFDDSDEVWEAPKHEATLTRWEGLKIQLNSEQNGGRNGNGINPNNVTEGMDPINGAVLLKLKNILIDK